MAVPVATTLVPTPTAAQVGQVTDGATLPVQIAYRRDVVKQYHGIFLATVIAAIIVIVVELILSKAGDGKEVLDYYVGWAFLIGWAFMTFHPNGIGTAYLFGAGEKAPWDSLDELFTKLQMPDVKLGEMGGKGLEFVKTKYLMWSGHVALFAALMSMVLATFQVVSVFMAAGAFLGLVGIGLWAALLTKNAKYYKIVTIWLFAITTTFAFAGTFMHDPVKTTKAAVASVLPNATVEEDIEITSLNPVIVCGMQPNTQYTFVVDGNPVVTWYKQDGSVGQGYLNDRRPLVDIVAGKATRNNGKVKSDATGCSPVRLVVPAEIAKLITGGKYTLGSLPARVAFK
jgi:hypothetical protein